MTRGDDGRLAVRSRCDVDEASIVVHDAHPDAGLAFQLAQLAVVRLAGRADRNLPQRRAGGLRRQARRRVSMPPDRQTALQKLVAGRETWTVL